MREHAASTVFSHGSFWLQLGVCPLRIHKSNLDGVTRTRGLLRDRQAY